MKPTVAFGSVEKTSAVLDGVIKRLEAAAVEQVSKTHAARIGTRNVKRLVAKLRQELMRPVVRTARPLFRGETQLLSAMTLSNARDPERVAAAALGMADAIEPYSKELTDVGFPDDFADTIRTAALEVRTAIDARAADFARRLGSTQATQFMDAPGRRIVSTLDAMVAPALADDPERLREWQALVHVVRRPADPGLVSGENPMAASPPLRPAPMAPPTVVMQASPAGDAVPLQLSSGATELKAA